MSTTVSPLAPKEFIDPPAIEGVRLATGSAGIKYQGRTDVLLAAFDKGTAVAVFGNVSVVMIARAASRK